jgi:hypothetical protein
MSDNLPPGLMLRLDVEENGAGHLYSVLDDEQTIEILRDMADGLEEEGSTPVEDEDDEPPVAPGARNLDDLLSEWFPGEKYDGE